ncbi:MAG TPA: NADP-dependent oxidoreductase, partial [Polyangiaceae bacterium]|nr:NADP-dependent oxidoreductase [Polyangiaceae bacterium]
VRAALLTGYGSNDKVEVRADVPTPSPEGDELLVEVHAAGLNPLDFKTRDGKLRVLRRYPLPIVFGNEVAGRVAALGPDARRFRVGDEVFARLDKDALGAFGEYARVREPHAAPKPPALTMAESAAVPLAALTAWQCLDSLGVGKDTRVLVHAGSGGVGAFALQFARLRGAHVATTTSSRNVELVHKLGADVVIDYNAKRFEDELSDYDGVLDALGGETLFRSFRVLKPGGKVVSIAGPPEPGTARRGGFSPWLVPLFWVASLRARRAAAAQRVSYEYLFMHPDGAQLERIGRLSADGKVSVVVDRTYPLEDVRAALAYLETGRARGKIVLTVR